MPAAVAADEAAALRDKFSAAVALASVMVTVSMLLESGEPLVLIVALGNRLTIVCSVNAVAVLVPPAAPFKSTVMLIGMLLLQRGSSIHSREMPVNA
jgi:hypothetical protein